MSSKTEMSKAPNQHQHINRFLVNITKVMSTFCTANYWAKLLQFRNQIKTELICDLIDQVLSDGKSERNNQDAHAEQENDKVLNEMIYNM